MGDLNLGTSLIRQFADLQACRPFKQGYFLSSGEWLYIISVKQILHCFYCFHFRLALLGPVLILKQAKKLPKLFSVQAKKKKKRYQKNIHEKFQTHIIPTEKTFGPTRKNFRPTKYPQSTHVKKFRTHEEPTKYP